MYRLNPYLNLGGNCAEAFRFYQKLFGAAEPMMMRFGDTEMADQLPEPVKTRIMHAEVVVGAVTLMGSDAVEMPDTPESAYQWPQGITVSINVDEPAEADRLFAALSEGDGVRMPIAETFWARRFGMCTDRFGIPWMVNCSKPQG